MTRCRPPDFDPLPAAESPFCGNLGIATFGAFAGGRPLVDLGRQKAGAVVAFEMKLEDRAVGSGGNGCSIEFSVIPSDAWLVEGRRLGDPPDPFPDFWSDMAKARTSSSSRQRSTQYRSARQETCKGAVVPNPKQWCGLGREEASSKILPECHRLDTEWSNRLWADFQILRFDLPVAHVAGWHWLEGYCHSYVQQEGRAA